MSYLAKRKRRLRNAVSLVPMAPMIDMVFLLLVFFMCVSSLSQAGSQVEVALPESKAAKVPDDLSGRITVSVSKEGTLFLNGQELDSSELRRRLFDYAESGGALKLRIRADSDTTFDSIRKTMKLAAEAGISDIIYATHQMK